ncbi:hypothetical protein DUNSADRAFT_4067 [Dunaliella salina]|uniref:Uncharacterized protein n=1 Tax=Dunaliella salina TaxID=3046 RepID=A0ABQ7GSN9_DUNSA|nr:hypothetical protein DUNSADRAFT_4067 [Dunaliella salina]|eukprot:KAF5837634.1 hypothetical protein DUNSADRAFT_4067 [Dunaliella salina]
MWIIVGMNLLGNIKLHDNVDGINRHANYRHFGSAMLLQLRMLSLEEWNAVMHDAMELEECILVKQDVTVTANGEQRAFEAGQFLDPVDDGAFISQMSWRVYVSGVNG